MVFAAPRAVSIVVGLYAMGVFSGCGGGGQMDAANPNAGLKPAAVPGDEGVDGFPPWWEELPRVDTPQSPEVVLSVQPEPQAATRQEALDICLDLDVNNGRISGAQADILWDPECLAAEVAREDQGVCELEPDTGRSTFMTRLLGTGRIRVLMVNLLDTHPMPASVSRLFCCSFRVVGSGGSRCEVDLDWVVFSDPDGQRLLVEVHGGAVEVSG